MLRWKSLAGKKGKKKSHPTTGKIGGGSHTRVAFQGKHSGEGGY